MEEKGTKTASLKVEERRSVFEMQRKEGGVLMRMVEGRRKGGRSALEGGGRRLRGGGIKDNGMDGGGRRYLRGGGMEGGREECLRGGGLEGGR